MPPQPLVVRLRTLRDAECVVRALASYSTQIDEVAGLWDVHVDIRSRSLDGVLTALHDCLRDNGIPQVRVTVDDKTYSMEPRPLERA